MAAAFVDALAAAQRPVVMEVKRRAADGTDLFAGRSLVEIVRAYEAAGAPCLSVVTGRWFGGDPGMLAAVAGTTRLPVLLKDFVTSRRQLATARDQGASAVLLTAAVLPRAQLAALVEAAVALGLTPFVEITTEDECAGLAPADHCVVAVNNKDIADRERGPTHIARSLDLLPAVRRCGPAGAVSASGIDTPETAARLIRAGYDGVLVGTTLLRSGAPGDWADHLEAALTARTVATRPPAGGGAPARRASRAAPS